MEELELDLDLDSLLRSHGTSSSDDDDDDDGGAQRNGLHRRTVDEILNDTNSSSSSSGDEGIPPLSTSSSISLPGAETTTKRLQGAGEDKMLEEAPLAANAGTLEEPAASYPLRKTYTEPSSSSSLSSLPPWSSFASSRPLPPLFGGVRPNPKPGAALAAAAAASRSVPTPFAAAIKSRRASSRSLEKILQPQEPTGDVGAEESANFEGFEGRDPSERSHPNGELHVESNTRVGISDPSSSSSSYSSPDSSKAKDISGEVQCSEEISVDTEGVVESLPSNVGVWTIKEMGAMDEGSKIKEVLVDSNFVASTSSNRSDSACEEGGNFLVSVAEHAPHYSSPAHEDVEKPELENNSEFSEADREILGRNTSQHGGATDFQEQSKSRSDTTELLEERLSQLESSRKASRMADKKLCSSMKPLEWAEELEKRQASSGLHWEEGAAAQPMRLEGIKRGPPAVGYLQIDPENVITHSVSSPAFQRDYGSPQVMAVHMNFIAVGMSKGVVLMVPSKYSAHCVDNMDAKMLMLGSQGEKIQSPVTSMCFNQQGDLLLVGYGDGHLTIWDVQKGTAAKVITGEHMAPVVHTLFLGQDSQVTRQFKAVTGDSKGLVLLHAFSVVPLLNRFSSKTQCLLDGQRTGTVLSASPLLMDDHSSGGHASTQGNLTVSTSGLGSMVGGVVGGVVGGESGWKLFNEGSLLIEEGVVIFVTHQNALVVRLSPNLEVYEKLSKPDGVREGSMPYTAWKCTGYSRGSASEHLAANASDKASWLAIAWDQKVQVIKLVKSVLIKYVEWSLDSEAIGVAWLDDQMLVVITLSGHLCLYAKDGNELHRTSFIDDGFGGDDIIAYHTYFTNIFGNPEKAYHNSIAVRGSTIYILGSMHLIVSRILPWKERIQVLQKAGDWMGALDMAMRLYDGQAHGVIDLPRSVNAIREVIMPYLVEMLLLYVDEVFSYISVASCNQNEKVDQVEDPNFRNSYMNIEMEEQFARVGGVAVEFCIHIDRTDILFDDIFSKFVAVWHGGTFLEILEPYILKDMLGCLPPEIMQALVEHYSSKGWLRRVEQCVLHMDISSVDFDQVVRLCREHGLYGALIYLFNQGLDDFRTPLEELLVVIQSAQKADATIGYKMLIYLKYCFLGLAFPPGHGTLPTSRLPSLRKELLQFLLDDSSVLTTQVLRSFQASYGACPNLCYLLWLDTESTLEVLKYAFVDDASIKSENSSDHLVDDNMVDKKVDAFESEDDQNMMVQNLVNSLILFLDMDSDVIRSSWMDDSKYQGAWPSKKDVDHVIEFIAYFVAWKRVTVSGKVVKHILEYLTSYDLSVGAPMQKSKAQREKQVLSLLKVVPETDWDSSHVLHLCIKAQFYRACGLIHTIRDQYIPALDSYMKEVDEPAYVFAFIHDMLLKLNDTEYSSFRSAVISLFPELVKLSREEAFLLVIDHFSVQHIQSELQSHPRSLFLFLKTIIDVHFRGTLSFSALERSQISDAPCGIKIKEEYTEIEPYLERLSNFPKILEHSQVHVDDETLELYLELLCQHERNSVLKFLETFDNYRLERCLQLCQEHGVNDAAAFLLERVGDIGNALVLLMTGLDEKFAMLATAVENAASEIISRKSINVELLSAILSMDEVVSVHDVLHASIGLCQRNTQRLDPQESRSLWFQLLDSYCGPLRELYEDKEISEGRNHVGTLFAKSHLPEVKEKSMFIQSFPKFNKGVSILRRVFSQFIREIIEGMVGYMPLSAIMAKLLADNGNQEFGDFKYTILSMLGTYGYERRILGTAKSLIEDDTYYTMTLLRKGASHAYAPHSFVCSICGCLLTKESSSSGVRVFNCGHAAHLHCDSQENGTPDKDSSAGCPICLPKRRTTCPRSKSILMENGLIKSSISRSQTIKGITSVHHLHEPTALEKPYGMPQMSKFEILNTLQKAQVSFQIDILPQLRLSPPAIYHEKVQKGSAVLSREINNSVENEKPNKSRQLWDPKSKGLSIRFPLKSSIFGTEKYGTR